MALTIGFDESSYGPPIIDDRDHRLRWSERKKTFSLPLDSPKLDQGL